MQLPGVGFDFKDVTSVFTDAGHEMERGECLFMEDFTLYDAMGAIEIGEPRLDNGLIAEEEDVKSFNPRTPLLPQEVCWIMDRSFGYEGEWHQGNALSQTIFTLRYVHHIPSLDIEYMPCELKTDEASRIAELVFVVLRAYVIGYLKCTDLSWRELYKQNIQDTEDWQSEKCDVSLLEGMQVRNAISILEEAENWLAGTTKKLSDIWRNALLSRLRLRKNILELLQADVFTTPHLQDLINSARQHLIVLRSTTISDPYPPSPALLAFDPQIGRLLKTLVPLRTVPVPTPEKTWQSISAYLDGWQELAVLSKTHNLSTWEVVGNLCVWLPSRAPQIPYLRSYFQSVFFDGLLVLNKFSLTWVAERFVYETLGVPYVSIARTIKEYAGPDSATFCEVEHLLSIKLIIPHIRGHWLNRPRRRRHLAKSLLDWHLLYDKLLHITARLESTDIPKDHVALYLPQAALIWRLSCMREVIFSGFQLELYGEAERPIAYWYSTQVLEAHLACLDNLLKIVPAESGAYKELQFQHQLLSALQALSTAVFVVIMSTLTFDWSQLRPAFYRRYKWAFKPEYDRISTPPVAHPELCQILPMCSDVLQAGNESYSPAGSVHLAEEILSNLFLSGNAGGWPGPWAGQRLQFIQCLLDICNGLHGLPASIEELEESNLLSLKWDAHSLRWFPSM